MKNKKLVLGCVLAALLCVCLFFANAFFGNPVSRLIARESAQKYVNANYSHLNLKAEKPFYNFKDSHYYVNLSSETSVDTHFSLSFSYKGDLISDSYENVTSGFNTMMRLDSEYRKLTDSLIEKLLENSGEKSFGFCSLDYGDKAVPNLEIDGEYNISALGADHGTVILYIEDGDFTAENMISHLLRLKKLFDDENIGFNRVDLSLTDREGESISYYSLNEFLYSDYEANDLSALVKEKIAATEDYYEKLDAEKQDEISKA